MIIGLSGKKRAGKDTLADHLCARHGFVRVAFADPLRDIALDLDPWIMGENHQKARLSDLHVNLGGWEGIKADGNWIPEVRRILQHLGVAVRTHIHTDTWVNAAMVRALEFEAVGVNVAVTDMRFPNEVEIIRDRGGLIVRIERDSLPAESLVDQHVSETLLDDMSLLRPNLVINSDPFDTFFARADAVLGLGEGR